MECDFHGTGQIGQLTGALHIHSAIAVQDAEHHAVHAQIFADRDVLLHDPELQVAVAEIAAAWPDHHHDADVQHLPGRLDGAHTRGGAPLEQVVDQLDAVSTTGLS